MRTLFCMMILFLVGADTAGAAPKKKMPKGKVYTVPSEPNKKYVIQENQTLDFEGLSLDSELKSPGEFYFQNRNQERFDSLTKRRTNFRREMLRDSVQSN